MKVIRVRESIHRAIKAYASTQGTTLEKAVEYALLPYTKDFIEKHKGKEEVT